MGTVGLKDTLTAAEFARRFKWLERFDDTELSEITICEAGEPLDPGDQYFDISRPERGIITAGSADRVGEGTCLVSRRRVSDGAWKKLTAPLAR